MHKKMDHSKIASLVFSHKSKELNAFMKLLMSIIGMIVHGHGDIHYAHYGLDIFLHDSNYIVGYYMAKFHLDPEGCKDV